MLSGGTLRNQCPYNLYLRVSEELAQKIEVCRCSFLINNRKAAKKLVYFFKKGCHYVPDNYKLVILDKIMVKVKGNSNNEKLKARNKTNGFMKCRSSEQV